MQRTPEDCARTINRWLCRRHLKQIARDSARRFADDDLPELCVWLDIKAAPDELPPGVPAEARAMLRAEVALWARRRWEGLGPGRSAPDPR